MITALLIAALAAAAIAMVMAASAARTDSLEAMQRTASLREYARGGVEWARGVLFEDARADTVDHLGELWAQPLAGVPVDGAIISGRIVDAQSRFNLNSLIANNRLSEAHLKLFRALLQQLDLDPDLAYAVVDWIDADNVESGPAGAEDARYLTRTPPYRAANRAMQSIDELYRVQGFTDAVIEKLAPHVIALPTAAPINLNTVTPPLLAALMLESNADERNAFVRARTDKPIMKKEDIARRLPRLSIDYQTLVGVSSAHFVVTALAASEGQTAAIEALVARAEGKWPAIIHAHFLP